MTKIKTSLVSVSLIIFPLLAKAQWGLPANTELPSGGIFDIIENLMLWLLMLVGIVAIIGFVISGIMYFLAAGDEKQVEKAKEAMKASIIGVVVALSGYVILQAVDTALNASDWI